jgi:hypothetical protein
MTAAAINAFTPGAVGVMSVTATSTRLLMPGSGFQTVLIVNHGPYPVKILLGTSAVIVADATGTVIFPEQSLALGVGVNTYIAAKTIGAGPFSSELNISTGA